VSSKWDSPKYYTKIPKSVKFGTGQTVKPPLSEIAKSDKQSLNLDSALME